MINRQKSVTAVAACAAVLLAAGLMVYRVTGDAQAQGRGERAFYSVDDGATWFVDSADQISGFEHEGRPAYRAYVFRAPGVEPFVGYLERYTPEARAKLQARLDAGAPAAARSVERSEQEVKKPGDAQWHKRSSPQVSRVINITAPDGTTQGLEPVLP